MVSVNAPTAAAGGLDGVERRGDGPVADGVEVDLESLRVEGAYRVVQLIGLDEKVAAVRAVSAGSAQVGPRHRRGKRLADPVDHHLDRSRAEHAGGGDLATAEKVVNLFGAAGAVPPQCAANPSREAPF